MGIQGMKSTANSKLLHSVNLRDCLSYVLSLPIHCLALGCTTIGQIEDDVRIAQQFKPLTTEESARIPARAEKFKGPALEDWKRNVTKRHSECLTGDGVCAYIYYSRSVDLLPGSARFWDYCVRIGTNPAQAMTGIPGYLANRGSVTDNWQR
jgi:hypothetical protein